MHVDDVPPIRTEVTRFPTLPPLTFAASHDEEPALHLRRYEEADAPVVRRLHDEGLRELGVHAGDGPWDDDLGAVRANYNDRHGEFLVGTVDGDVVAMGALRRVTDTVGEIKRMRVEANHRRRGFARAVLDRLEARARELGYRTLRLDTTIVQISAQRLYTTGGYRETGRTRDRAGHETLRFEKRIA